MDLVKVDSILEEINRRFFDIPFGNSAFQNRKFVMEAQYTPERAYRALGLRLYDRINALNEARYNMRRREVDILELKEKAAGEDKFAAMRAVIDLEEKESQLAYFEKMVNDAIVEVSTLWGEIRKMPEFTRAQFEAAEQEHFQIRLDRQVKGIAGAADSLDLITRNNDTFSRLLENRKQNLIGE